MNILWEAMVDEMRAERIELDVRRHFTEHKQPIELTRGLLEDWTGEPESNDMRAARTADNWRLAGDLIEVG
jgi:hypothetical protein